MRRLTTPLPSASTYGPRPAWRSSRVSSSGEPPGSMRSVSPGCRTVPGRNGVAEDELVRPAGVVELDQVPAEVDRAAARVGDGDRLVAARLHVQAHLAGQRVAARHQARVDLRRAQVALRVEQVGAVAHRPEARGDVLERGLLQAPVLREPAGRAAADAQAQRLAGRDDGRVGEPVAGHVVGAVAQPGVAHPPAAEPQVAPAAVVDVDPLAVEVLRVVAVGVPVDRDREREVLVGAGAAGARVVEALARAGGALRQHGVLAVVGVLDAGWAATARARPAARAWRGRASGRPGAPTRSAAAACWSGWSPSGRRAARASPSA